MLKNTDILQYRLIHQQIAGTAYRRPEEIVHCLGAMQAQEYAMAKWAIGLRLPELCEQDVEEAFRRGDILRTHFLRPTWHFVTPEDIRWMLNLSAPRVHAANAYMYRKQELDATFFKRTHHLLAKTLEGGNHYTRAFLKTVLERENIMVDTLRMSCIMMAAELDGIICSGPREGKQFTYALLDERVPPAPVISREEALVLLATRYFSSRGPASIRDFVWWSGLTVKEAKAAIEMLGKHFRKEQTDGQEYIFLPPATVPEKPFYATFLLPDYDEYGISYKDRTALFGKDYKQNKVSPYAHMVVVDGKITGTWKVEVKNKKTEIMMHFFRLLTPDEQEAVRRAVHCYKKFMNIS